MTVEQIVVLAVKQIVVVTVKQIVILTVEQIVVLTVKQIVMFRALKLLPLASNYFFYIAGETGFSSVIVWRIQCKKKKKVPCVYYTAGS